MIHGTIRLFKIRGIPVGINWSWLFVFLLLMWSLAAVVFPARYPGHAGGTYLVMAAMSTLLFVASILFHELSHTLQSVREGVPVREVTLWLFGGMAQADEPMPSPGAEFRIVAAGPLATAGLVVTFWATAAAGSAVGLPDTVVGVSDYLAGINVLLLVFNLVPALPLDGGRLLHAVLWRRSGDREEATLSAAAGGRAFAFVLIGLGLLGLLTGLGLAAVWFVFLGWFLLAAVNQEVVSALLERAIKGLRVRDLMARDLVTVSPGATIDELVTGVARRSPHGAYPVLEGHRLVGMLPFDRAGSVPPDDRLRVRVADIMLPATDVPVVKADDPMIASLEALGREPGRAVVVNGGADSEIIGLVSTTDLTRALQSSTRPGGSAGPRRRAGVLISLIVTLMALAVVAAFYYPPFVVVEPGEAFDIRNDVTVTGAPVQEPTGPIMMTSVRLDQPSALDLLLSLLRTDREIVALDDVMPSGVSADEVEAFQRRLFLDSQQMAAAAAARAAGYEATLTGTGAEVVGVLGSAPAAAVLQPADVITAVDGTAVATANELRTAVGGRRVADRVRLTIEREGERIETTVAIAQLPTVAGATGIGVITQTRDLEVDLPFAITFADRPDVGGPSAGLAYALVIVDMLDQTDDVRSRAIAATGTIAADGTIGEVGGTHEKAIAAHDAGADLLIVPTSEVGDTDLDELEVRGATTLDEAVRVLEAT